MQDNRSAPSTGWRQLGFVRRSDKVNTPLMLLIADAAMALEGKYSRAQLAEVLAVPVQGGVSAEARLEEALRVRGYWSVQILYAAAEYDAPWHTLTEPPRWDDVTEAEVRQFIADHIDNFSRWPTVGALRRAFGRVTNHRGPGDVAGQATLPGAF